MDLLEVDTPLAPLAETAGPVLAIPADAPCETDYVRFSPGDRVAQASNASFDALTFEVWGALLNGATLVGIDRETLLSPRVLREVLREQGITTLYQTTALLNQLSCEQPDLFAPLASASSFRRAHCSTPAAWPRCSKPNRATRWVPRGCWS